MVLLDFSFIEAMPTCPDNIGVLEIDGKCGIGDVFKSDDHIRYPDDFAKHVNKSVLPRVIGDIDSSGSLLKYIRKDPERRYLATFRSNHSRDYLVNIQGFDVVAKCVFNAGRLFHCFEPLMVQVLSYSPELVVVQHVKFLDIEYERRIAIIFNKIRKEVSSM